MGRARLASSTAFQTFISMKAFSPQEIRNQAIQDGLFSITIPDELPADSEFPEPELPAPEVTGTQKKKVGKLTGSNKAGNPKPATQGGEGEFNTRSLADDKILLGVQKMVEAMPHIAQYLSDAGEDDREVAKLILKIEPPVLEYLSELGNITGSREYADLLFDESIKIIDEFEFDNLSDINYDGMVENLIGRSKLVLANKVTEYEYEQPTEEVIETVVRSYDKDYEDRIIDKVIQVLSEVSTPISSDNTTPTKEGFTVLLEDVKSLVQSSLARNQDVNVVINNPSQPAPIVNQSINVPQQEAPTVIVQAADFPKVEFPAPIINVEAPTVNVAAPNVTIEPPVNNIEVKSAINNIDVKPADVKLPKVKREHQIIQRDQNNNIGATETTFEYEDGE